MVRRTRAPRSSMSQSTSWRRRRGVVASFLLGLGLLLPSAAPVSARIAYYPEMSGDQEVPGPGDPDAQGLARMTINVADGEVCVEWDIVDMDAAVAAHIHAGAVGVSGNIIVTLPTPAPDGTGSDCVTGLDAATLQPIVDNPNDYYVNVHTASFENGAIRGQVGDPVETFTLTVMVVGCQPGQVIDPTEELYWAQCSPVFLPADDPGVPPPGYTYFREPILATFDMQVSDGIDLFTMDDASRSGDGFCNTTSLQCVANAGYQVDGELHSNATSVQQFTFPPGFGPGAALLQAGDDTPEPLVVTDGTVAFDSTGVDSLFLLLINRPASGPVPTAPPTSTVETGPAEPGAGIALALAVIAAVGVAGGWMASRRRLHRAP